MIPELFDRVWRAGELPKLRQSEATLRNLLRQAYATHTSEHPFWGILDFWHHHEDHTYFHVYNYGSIHVRYPWQAVLSNWGLQWNVEIRRAGTSLANPGHPCPLSRTEPPFLVFESLRLDAWDERLFPAMLFHSTPPPLYQSVQVRFTVPPSAGSCSMQYCLRVSTPVQCSAPIDDSTILTFEDPMAVEPGEIIIMHDQKNYYIGLVEKAMP